MVREAMEGAVGRYDALLSAVAPSAAYKFGEKLDDPLAMYKGDLMTVGLNLSGAWRTRSCGMQLLMWCSVAAADSALVVMSS